MQEICLERKSTERELETVEKGGETVVGWEMAAIRIL